MSKSNESDSVATIKEGLGKLASPIDDATVAVRDLPDDRRARVKRNVKRGLLIALGLFCVGLCTVAGYYLSNPTIRHILATMVSNPGRMITRNGFDPTGVYNLTDNFPPDKRKSITVLVLGSDHDTVGKRVPGHIAVPLTVMNAPGRSDAIMIARFEFDGDSVSSLNVLSIPRDTRVRVPGFGIHKINAAHAYGGPELSCATVRSVFQINPDYFVDLNFEGFKQIVDAVGGVDINVHPQADGKGLDYDDNWGDLHIHLKPGPQHLNGYKAMGYVRFRHTDNDLARAQRQHEFLEALRSRISSPASFGNLPKIVDAVTNNLHSTMTMDQLLTLANLARKAPKDAICLDTLPVIQGKTFVYIDRRKSVGVIHKMFFKESKVADLNINTPDSDAVATPRRKRHLRDSDPAPEIRHRKTTDDSSAATTGDSPSTDAPSADPPDASSTKPDSGAKDDKPEKSEKPAPADTPKSKQSDDGAGDDGGKAPSKGKEGTGTSSGNASTVLRG